VNSVICFFCRLQLFIGRRGSEGQHYVERYNFAEVGKAFELQPVMP
jgi:hypothetical protein